MIPRVRLESISLLLGLLLALAGRGLTAEKGATFPSGVIETTYPCSSDNSPQPTLFYAPNNLRESRPLLVGLHTWSGNYQQEGSIPMAQWCVDHQWIFVHPNFRGQNWTPEACGSDTAVRDIVDAVAFARSKATVDPKRIYLMGTSGGGHMALLMAGRHPELWAGVSAWVPISDLSAWFYECQVAGQRYALDLIKVFGAPPHHSEPLKQAYAHRSPITWLHRARTIPIDINAGIRDGHDGSVPISHSLMAFNRLVPEEDRVAFTDIITLTGKKTVPENSSHASLRDPIYGTKQPLFRKVSGSTRLTIFDGAHEGLPEAGLTWLARQRKP